MLNISPYGKYVNVEESTLRRKIIFINSFLVSGDFCRLLINFANSFWPRSGPTKRRSGSGSNLFDTLVVFLKDVLKKKMILKKCQQKTTKARKLSCVQRVNVGTNLNIGVIVRIDIERNTWIMAGKSEKSAASRCTVTHLHVHVSVFNYTRVVC